MKKLLLSLVIAAMPLFSGDAQKIIQKLEEHQPSLMDCSPDTSAENIRWVNCIFKGGVSGKGIYTLSQETSSAKIDSWYEALKQAEQFIKKNNPGILKDFYKVREESNTTINAMKTIYNHTMKDADLDFDAPIGDKKTFKDKKSLQSAEKLLDAVRKLEKDAYTCHLNFSKDPEEVVKKKLGFFTFDKKNKRPAILLLETIKDIVAQHILMLMQSFSSVKKDFERK
jgi:hypothetical protein